MLLLAVEHLHVHPYATGKVASQKDIEMETLTLGQLVPISYFDRISRLMRRQGLREFARVAISTDDVRYHVPARVARSTSLFFSLSQRAFIVQMEYNEADNCDECERLYPSGRTLQGVLGYWSLRFYHKFLEYGKLLDRVKHHDPELWDSELAKVPFHGHDPEFSGFQNYGNRHYQQPGIAPGRIATGKLVTEIGHVAYTVADWLAGPQFDDLQVTCFPPYYTFPGCENIFWDRFGRHNLRPFIKKSWGSDGLKR